MRRTVGGEPVRSLLLELVPATPVPVLCIKKRCHSRTLASVVRGGRGSGRGMIAAKNAFSNWLPMEALHRLFYGESAARSTGTERGAFITGIDDRILLLRWELRG